MVFFYVIITLVVGSIDETTTTNIFIDSINQGTNPGFLDNLSRVWTYMTLFFRLASFQVDGIPAIFNVLLFFPLSAGIIFMIISILRRTD